MEARTLQRRLVAVGIGVAIAVLAVVGTHVLLPAQSACDATKDYGYVYSGAKSSSVDFLRASWDNDSLLMLGSSEFSTPAKTVPQVPAQTFGAANYGLHASLVGEAFDQCLWHAIALGAIADGPVPRGKVVIICGLGQFTDGGLDNATFGERFSYSLYRGFCDNAAIPEELRSYVRRRLEEQGVDATTLRSGMPENPLDTIDGAVLADIDDLRLRKELMDVRERGIDRAAGEATTPDWAALRADALECAKAKSTNNDWGVEDGFYEKQLAPQLEDLRGSRADETYTDTPEYDDLECFLDVCDACGVEPLVVVQPVLGPYYDHIGISKQTREAAYQHIRDIVRTHEHARIADFSDREYEQYFLFDIVHFGWTGWIDAEQAIYEFAMGGTDGTR